MPVSGSVLGSLSLLIAVLLSPAAAQPLPADSTTAPAAHASSRVELGEFLDTGTSIPPLANELVNALGRSWAAIQPTLAVPDSSAMDRDLGDVWWSVPESSVEGIRAFVQRGRIESVTLDFSPDGPDLAALARRLYDQLGSPRADGFYAVDQTGYPFSLAIDALANRLTVRAVPGQVVTD